MQRKNRIPSGWTQIYSAQERLTLQPVQELNVVRPLFVSGLVA